MFTSVYFIRNIFSLTDVLEEMLSSGFNPSASLLTILTRLARRIQSEQESVRELLELQGALEMLFSTPQPAGPLSPSHTLYEPSVGAARELCVNVS